MRLGRPTVAVILTEDERVQLESWAHRSRTAPQLARRARLVLTCAAGRDNKTVAKRLRLSPATVGKWRARFVRDRVDGLLDEPRPGAPRTVTDAQVERVVMETLEMTPRGATHWSTRSLARATGLSEPCHVRLDGAVPAQQPMTAQREEIPARDLRRASCRGLVRISLAGLRDSATRDQRNLGVGPAPGEIGALFGKRRQRLGIELAQVARAVVSQCGFALRGLAQSSTANRDQRLPVTLDDRHTSEPSLSRRFQNTVPHQHGVLFVDPDRSEGANLLQEITDHADVFWIVLTSILRIGLEL